MADLILPDLRKIAEAEPQPGTEKSGLRVPLSPVVSRLVTQHQIDIADLVPTGLGGRITISDVERYLNPELAAEPEPEPVVEPVAVESAAPAPEPEPVVEPVEEIPDETEFWDDEPGEPAEQLFASVEVDFEAVEYARTLHKITRDPEEPLSYLAFVIRALAETLREFPFMNVSLGQTGFEAKRELNLALDLEADDGTYRAGCICWAGTKRLEALEDELIDLFYFGHEDRCNQGQIPQITFRISDAVSYGSMARFGAIEHGEIAILSTGGVQRKPVVVTDDYSNESIAVHSVGLISLSWRSDVIETSYASSFLAALRSVIETRDWKTEVL